MTPKEKAKQLVKCFKYEDNLGIAKNTGIEGIDENQAKQCALILVNEMLNNFLSNKTTAYGRERYHFWQQVKQEIEKL